MSRDPPLVTSSMPGDSPSSSPPRKRQRLSPSPSYDFDDVSEDHLAALEQLESVLTQTATSRDDLDNRFTLQPAIVTNTSGVASTFNISSNVQLSEECLLPSSPDTLPPEPDCSRWFEPIPEPALSHAVFQTAKFAATSSSVSLLSAAPLFSSASMAHEATPSIQSLSSRNNSPVAFKTASTSMFLTPSLTALQKAEEQMKIWQSESDISDPSPSSPRSALQPMENSHIPTTEVPAKPAIASFNPPFPKVKAKQKPFKSPLLSPNKGFKTHHVPSPLNPNRPFGFTSAALQNPHPLASTSITASSSTPLLRESLPSTPVKVCGLGENKSTPRKPKFVTPFKKGMNGNREPVEMKKEAERPRARTRKEVVTFSAKAVDSECPESRKAFNLCSYPSVILHIDTCKC
jgi:hypothetical protein